jgi:hypothetical protein
MTFYSDRISVLAKRGKRLSYKRRMSAAMQQAQAMADLIEGR